MQDFDIKQQWQELKDTLRPMPWKKKLEHLWEYYKWVLVVLAVVGMIVYISVVGYSNARVEGLFYGDVCEMALAGSCKRTIQCDMKAENVRMVFHVMFNCLERAHGVTAGWSFSYFIYVLDRFHLI